MPDVRIRPGAAADLLAMGELYLRAFPDSTRYLQGRRPLSPQGPADAFAIVLAAEPEAVFVAEAEGKLCGYCLAPARVDRLWAAAWRSGLAWRILGRALTGRYHLNARALWRLAINWLLMQRPHGDGAAVIQAHILSLAVDPAAQGQGLGRRLLRAAMERFAALGVLAVQLEVRPDNEPARRLYETEGFVTVGQIRDSQGPWLVMVKEWPR